MANYFNWLSKHPEHKLLYYICGEEETLSLEVLDGVKSQFMGEKLTLSCKGSWASIEQAVLTEAAQIRVVVLTYVDLLDETKKDILLSWAKRIVAGDLPLVVLVIYTREVNPDTALPLFRPFVDKGRFVECKQLSVDNMKKYAMTSYGCTEQAALVLMELVSYNFRLLNNELEKLACLSDVIDEDLVKELVVFSADDMLVNYLLRRMKDNSVRVVSAVPQAAIIPVLSHLTRKLAFLYMLIQADGPGMGAHKLAAILGVQPWQLLEYFAIKKYWNAPQVLQSLKLLTTMEEHYHKHASNILTLLAAWW